VSTLSVQEALASPKNEARRPENVAAGAKRELRVLHVFSGLGMGGAETWLMSLLKYFREAENELAVRVHFDILLTGGEKANFDDEALALGARLFYVSFTRKNMGGFAREFRRILASGNYDAIHDHQDYSAGLHFLMGTGHLPPIRIAHVHNPLYHRRSYEQGLGRRLAKSAGELFLARFATYIMGTSRQVVTEYGFDKFASRGITLGAAHCGFDVGLYRHDYEATHAELCREMGWDESVKVMLFVGRLESAAFVHMGREMTHKNPAMALEIAGECITRDERVRLLMVGSGETKKREFEAKVREWGLAEKIRFLGIRSDVPRLMCGANLLLFPSLAEGLGMVVVEAQAAGLRVLASDTTPGECVVVPELVEFFSLEASPERWAEKAIHLISLARPKLCACGAAVQASPFSIGNSAALLTALYAGRA
jgi:glycosyltransferase involved in cell wall biosynthesis